MTIIENALFTQLFCPECGLQTLYDPNEDHVPHIFTGTLDDDAPWISSTMHVECRACLEHFNLHLSRLWLGPFDGSVTMEKQRIVYEGARTLEALAKSLKPYHNAKGPMKRSPEEQATWEKIAAALRASDDATALTVFTNTPRPALRQCWAWVRAAAYQGLPLFLAAVLGSMGELEKERLVAAARHTVRAQHPACFAVFVEYGVTEVISIRPALSLPDPLTSELIEVNEVVLWAILLGDVTLAERLIPTHKSSLWLPDSFYHAVRLGHTHLIQLFLERGCNGVWQMKRFRQEGREDCVRWLAEAGVPVPDEGVNG